jgi:glycerophosphoryl diester phosphodiesterase
MIRPTASWWWLTAPATPPPRRAACRQRPRKFPAALERCIALGVDMVEIDVRRTQDGALVIMHDAKVDRTTTARAGSPT